MKLALNGALTLGTLDGANVEILQHVGAENFYLFGLRADEIVARKREGYRPWEVAHGDPELHAVLELLGSGELSQGGLGRYAPLVHLLLEHDEYFVLADYHAYLETQQRAGHDYQDREAWNRRVVQTIARMGYFSSDRSILDYCRDIWHVAPVPIATRANAIP